MRDGIRVGAAALTLALMLTGPMAGRAGAQLTDDAIPALTPETKAVEACHVIFGRDAFADVPARALVSPGEPLSLDVTWGTDWKVGAPVEVVTCTALDGALSDSLSSRNSDEANDGLFVVEFNVPVGTSEGARLCERTVVIGQSAAGAPKAERLDAECFTVAAAAPRSSNKTGAGAAGNSGQQGAGERDRAAAGASPPRAPRPAQPGIPDGPTPTPSSGTSGGAPQQGLARTGSIERMLAAMAGLLMLLGGRMIAWSPPAPGSRSHKR